MKVHSLDSPNNQRPRSDLMPTVAAGGDARALVEAKKAVIWFRRCCRAAWLQFKETGAAVFPAGTLNMHHRHQQEPEEENGCLDCCVRMRVRLHA